MKLTTAVREAAFGLMPASLRPAARFRYYRFRGVLEPELAVACARLKPGMRAIDVGANEGVYTHAFAATGATVESFEPQRSCLASLHAYARRRASVHVHAVALGAAEGTAELFVPIVAGKAVSGHASLNASGAEHEHYHVPVRTLDSYGFANVAVIKIDVEGHEADVLLGAQKTIVANRPLLIVEIEQRHLSAPIAESFRAITDLGYRGSFLERSGREQPLTAFNPDEHQRASDADMPGAPYVNNFIFSPR